MKITSPEIKSDVRNKVYRVLPDVTEAQEGYLRIVDESTEDYLYPESYYIFLALPKKAQ